MLIAALIPAFLESGPDYFSKKFANIENERLSNSFLKRNILIVGTGQSIKLSEFLRDIAGFGYSKVWETVNRGEFSQRGGTVHIFPINSDKIFAIEFDGNVVSEIFSQNFFTENKLAHSNFFAFNPSRTMGSGASESDAPQKLKRASSLTLQQKNSGFQAGDFVVHIDHGIGIFCGEKDDDFIIEYAAPKNRPSAPDLLFVPKKEAKRISPYLGLKKPEIHRLGTTVWSITKRKAKGDIVAFAKDLLKILAERKFASRTAYESFSDIEEEFVSDFSHEYTQDQKKSLAEIFHDMSGNEPMDRILTGDVGFGKTEVAMSSALRAILNKKQVAVLAPTTILADQHSETFKARMEKFGVLVARLTRLEKPQAVKEITKKLEAGAIDLVVGTHKILGKNIKFKNLGLLIIDEEQKFGVSHKEKFKKLNPALDILTLSATPIPRTLYLTLSGLKKISSIEMPPDGKMEIKTFVLPKNKKIIKEAIMFELERGGQIYFLANRIHNIPQILEEIRSLKISGVKIGILHGRMSEEEIIKTMHNFRNGATNVLISTTIIENGLDLFNVNTLIVENATMLGLSQAHQLRGRIGRGNAAAFAYFLYPAGFLSRTKQGGRGSEKFWDRLEALEKYAWLGAGFELAKRDLEIRGAGNILGKAQSGVAYKIGLNLYFELLEKAIEELTA